MEHPLCSIIIATYCGGDKLSTTLSSLYRQSIKPKCFEIIIVDDGSPKAGADEISNACRTFEGALNMRIIRLPINGGPARARNAGLVEARGKYIFFTDDDCEVPALWLETHLRIYTEYPNISSVGGWYKFSKEDTNTNVYGQFWYLHYQTIFSPIDIESYSGPSPTPYSNIYPAQNTANLSVRRSVLETSIRFDEDFITPGGEDTTFAQQISMAEFSALFIPYHVLHTSPLTLKRFLKVIKNRGIAMYLRLEKTHKNNFSNRRWYRDKLTIYRSHLNKLSVLNVGVRKNRRKLIILAFLYYYGTASPLALRWHARRWRRAVQKRAIADAHAVRQWQA